MKRGKIIFAVIGWFLIALMVLSLVLRAWFRVRTGTDLGYLTYKFQPMTYLGLLATLGLVAVVGVIGLYYRAKRFVQQRISAREREGK